MDSKIRIAINGFGRIGRLTFRKLIQNQAIEVVAINDLADIQTLVHLLRYDSVHGPLKSEIKVKEESIEIDGMEIHFYQQPNPELLPWEALKVDVVIESTGFFTKKEDAAKHLSAGSKKVVISAPAKGDVKTIVLGVNEDNLTADDQIVSNASCTTNCLAPMVKVLDEAFGIEKGYISTVHAYTADQRLQDSPHRDLRRARAAAMSIIPTSTGAATAVGKVIPSMEGKLNGIALRVPVPDGSLTDFTVELKTSTTTKQVNEAFQFAAANNLKGILQYSTDPLVSADIVGNPNSCIIDSELTAVNGNLVKLVGWYDNEFGYASRTAELAMLLAKI